MRNQSIRRLVGTGLAVGGLTMGLLASSPATSGAAVKAKGASPTTLTIPQGIGSNPNSVFPFYSAAQCTTQNIDYWDLTTRPGYWYGFGGSSAKTSVTLDPSLSPLGAAHIAVTGANTTATIPVKGWLWSNGAGKTSKMTPLDVMFWINMDKAQSKQGANASCGYSPGFGFPDQVVSAKIKGNSVVVVFAGHASAGWLQNNELSQIVPLSPAWDLNKGHAAKCAEEAFAAVKQTGKDVCSDVFNYLSSLKINNSLWTWADGPYRQKSALYSAGAPSGVDVQVCNTLYSGPAADRCHAVKTIDYIPYTTIGAETSNLENGKLDIGTVLPTQVSASPGPGKAGHNLIHSVASKYNLVGSELFGVFYYDYNFDNTNSTFNTGAGNLAGEAGAPAWAELENNEYFRGAIQQSFDQTAVINAVDNGYGVPTYSAIPEFPANPYGTSDNPWHYSPGAGIATMDANNWNTNVTPAVCKSGGCGSNAFPIPAGTVASLTVLVPSGVSSVIQQATDEANETLTNADIQINVDSSDNANQVQAACFGGAAEWELCGYGGWIYDPDYYPSGEALFATGSSSNPGGYSNAEMNALIQATTNHGNTALNANVAPYGTSFAAWTAQDVPFMWQPTPTGFTEYAKTLKGIQTPNPLTDFFPEVITKI
jgi:peptide/nickel transport system substrate-binding protein